MAGRLPAICLLGVLMGCSDRKPEPEPQRAGEWSMVAEFDHSPLRVDHTALSPDGSLVATATTDPVARIWRTADGRLVRELRGHMKKLTGTVFSPDGRLLATVSRDKTVRLWSLQDGRCLGVMGPHDRHPNILFSPDGKRLLTTSMGPGTHIWMWDLSTRRLERKIEYEDAALFRRMQTCWAFSPDGRKLAAGFQNEVAVWDVESGELLHFMEGHGSTVLAVCLDPAGKLVLSGSGDTTARIWDSGSGECLHVLRGRRESVRWVGFSPGGGEAVTVGVEGTIRMWSPETGECVAVLGQVGRAEYVSYGISPAFTASAPYRLFAMNDPRGTVEYDLATRKILTIIPRGLEGCCVDRTGTWLALYSGQSVRLWHRDDVDPGRTQEQPGFEQEAGLSEPDP